MKQDDSKLILVLPEKGNFAVQIGALYLDMETYAITRYDKIIIYMIENE